MSFIAIGIIIDAVNLILGFRLSSGHRESGLPIVPVLFYCLGIGVMIWNGFGIFDGLIILLGLVFIHALCIFIIPWLVVLVKQRLRR